MKLRNKKTGEIKSIEEIIRDAFLSNELDSLKSIDTNWEDVDVTNATNIPLIKDEKIRKAVRAWAEMNDIRFIHMCSRKRKENARIVGQNALGRTFTMEINNEYKIRVCFKDYKECYTIGELCGEEEE